MQTTAKTVRYRLLDQLRGITLIAMMVYHTLWDLVYMFGVSIPWYRTQTGFIWQQSICWTFIVLSGLCFRLGKRPLKRGLLVLAGSMIVSLVSIIATPSSAIRFGVLTLIGSCMVLMILPDKVLKRANPYVGAAISFLLFAFTRYASRGVLGIFSLELLSIPDGLYRNLLTAYLGFPGPGFSSSDYFPLIPWLFLFAAGYFLYGIFQRQNWLRLLDTPRIPPLEWVGRHSLLLYMLHQPIIYGVLLLIME